MRILSFLAGAAAGALAYQWMARRSTQVTAPVRTFGAGTLRPAAIAPDDDLSAEPTHAPPQSDEQLRDRIRSHLASTIADAQAIDVAVSDGCVTLGGRVQARDAVLLMAQVENIPGVQRVDNKATMVGTRDEVAPPMTRDAPAVQAGERASSHLS